MVVWGVVLVLIGLLASVRLAPTDVSRWHVPVTINADKDLTGGAVRVIPDVGRDALKELRDIALSTERTELIAGSVEEGMMTFRTRSKLIGFPDFTTLQLSEDGIRMFARLRFGKSDMGVNAARLERWIDKLNRG